MNIRNGLEMITPETYGFIYMTHNMVNGKKYIGQKKISVRSNWRSYLGSGKELNNAIKKYGKDNFYKDILESCMNQEELDAREIYWITYYDAVNSPIFYNIMPGGRGNNVREYKHGQQNSASTYSEDQAKEVIRLLCDGWHTADIIKELNVGRDFVYRIKNKSTWTHLTKSVDFPIVERKYKLQGKYDYNTSSFVGPAILQYNLYGNFIHKYKNIEEIVELLGHDKRKSILDVCRHKRTYAYESLWFYEDDSTISLYVEDKEWLGKCRKYQEEWRTRLKNGNNTKTVKPIIQYDLHMNYIQTFPSMGHAATYLGVNISKLSAGLKYNDEYMGYKWRKIKRGGDEVSGSTE